MAILQVMQVNDTRWLPVAEGSAPTGGHATSQLQTFATQPTPKLSIIYRALRLFIMDTSEPGGRCGYIAPSPQIDQGHEAKRRRLNPDQQITHWVSQPTNAVRPEIVVGHGYWSSNYYNAHNYQWFPPPYQNLDHNQQVAVYPNQSQGFAPNELHPNQIFTFPSQQHNSDASPSWDSHGAFMCELDPNGPDLNTAPSLLPEANVLVCYGTVSYLSFDGTRVIQCPPLGFFWVGSLRNGRIILPPRSTELLAIFHVSRRTAES